MCASSISRTATASLAHSVSRIPLLAIRVDCTIGCLLTGWRLGVILSRRRPIWVGVGGVRMLFGDERYVVIVMSLLYYINAVLIEGIDLTSLQHMYVCVHSNNTDGKDVTCDCP